MAENPSITVAIVTVTGEAMKLEPGSTYAIELSKHFPTSTLEQIKRWGDEKDIRFLVLGPEAKIKREPEPCNMCEHQAGMPFCGYCGRKLK